MVRGGGRGEQQGIRPQDLEDRAPLDPVALPKRDVGPLATEQERGLAAWIAVRPLLKNLVVIDDEAVLVPDSVKDQVYLKTRRILLLARIQAERAARHPGLRVTVAKRVQHVPAHVAQGAQDVALPRGIRPEDASGGEHLTGRPPSCHGTERGTPSSARDIASIGSSSPSRNERTFSARNASSLEELTDA